MLFSYIRYYCIVILLRLSESTLTKSLLWYRYTVEWLIVKTRL